MEGSSQTPLKVLAFCGSLRKASYNRMALNAVRELLPDGMALAEFEIAAIPPYNEDVRQRGFPKEVDDMRRAIKDADALLFVSPEYNYSIPGALKNAIDWASRPPDQPFAGKPAAVMGASMSFTGTVRMQYHLRQSLVYLDVIFLSQPEVMIANAQNVFRESGALADDALRQRIRLLLEKLGEMAQRLKGPAPRMSRKA